MGYDELGFAFLAVLTLFGGAVFVRDPRRLAFLPKLVLAAIALRIVGAFVRHEVLFRFYGGLGDAVRYFDDGRLLASETSPFSPAYWLSGPRFWGTPFLIRLSGLVTSLTGPTLRGEFLVFSLMAFGGLYAMAIAFQRVQPGAPATYFARWIWFWPSLWFWPSSVGKEAVTVLAIGVATLGYVGRRGRIYWPVYLAGLGLAFLVRPHVAAVLAFATVAGHWLDTWQRLTARRLVEALVALVLAGFAFNATKTQLGLADADLEGIKEYVVYRAGQTMSGGSNIGEAPIAGGGVPMAFVNVWLRPFPWEAHNATALFAAAEIVVLWWLIWRRRSGLRHVLRTWRHHRLLQLAVPLFLAYTLMIGLTFANLGIIARQRAPLFPFLFMVVAALPAAMPERPRWAVAPPRPMATTGGPRWR
jgi:hypothetical protein